MSKSGDYIQHNKEENIFDNLYYNDPDVLLPQIHVDKRYNLYPTTNIGKNHSISDYEESGYTFEPTFSLEMALIEGLTIDEIGDKKQKILSTAQSSLDTSKQVLAKSKNAVSIDIYKRKFGIVDGSGIPIYELTGKENVFTKFVNYTSPNTADVPENTPIDVSNIHIALGHTFENQPKNFTTPFIKAILKLEDINDIRVLINNPSLPQFSTIFPIITPRRNDNQRVVEPQSSPYLNPDFLKQLEVYRDPIINQLLCFDHPEGCSSSSSVKVQDQPLSESFRSSCKTIHNHTKHDYRFEKDLGKLYLVLFGVFSLFVIYAFVRKGNRY